MSSPTLRALLEGLPLTWSPAGPLDAVVSEIVIDSRSIQGGELFVAMRGGAADGHDFIPDAVRRGAAAVVGDREVEGLAVPYVRVEDSRRALAWLAAAFHGHPGRKLTMVGVTGTDGKTTTCNLLHRILLAGGLRAGLISTVNAVIGTEVLDTGFHVTTPDAPDVQRYLARMVAAGLTHAVLETTSHGWAQHRVDACEFDVGVVTNITHEHLDEHGSFENYRAAKARLFRSLGETRPKPQGNPRLAVLNQGDSSYDYLISAILSVGSRGSKVRTTSYGEGVGAEVRAEDVKYAPSGTRFTAAGPGWSVPVASSLVGAFNVANCLAALTAAICGLGVDPSAAARGVADLPGVPGRMERIDLGQEFVALVDFAHTPNALRVAIETARGMARGRVITVFGSAGLRDREKRSLMAAVAAQLADVSILTAEDPRTEPLEEILEEMAAGARSRGAAEGRSFYRIPDRGEAIRLGVRLARPGDVLMACGKGHEQSMCFGTTEFPWDDRIAMRAALSELMGVEGPALPYLPTRGSPA